MTQTAPLSILQMIQGSFAYVRGALMPAFIGSVLFALMACLNAYIQEQQLFGAFSFGVALSFISSMGVTWLAMALRQGIGEANPGVGLAAGRQELALAGSVVGFMFVFGLIACLVGFLAFLLIMTVAAIGGGALSGGDVVNAPIFETPEAFRAFLGGTSTGRVVGVLGAAIAGGVALFLFWFVLRLSPFAAAAVAQKRFVVLQAMSWTRYKDRVLFGAGIPVIGLALMLIIFGRGAIAMLPVATPVILFLAHLLTCYCLLLVVGFICEVYRQTVP